MKLFGISDGRINLYSARSVNLEDAYGRVILDLVNRVRWIFRFIFWTLRAFEKMRYWNKAFYPRWEITKTLTDLIRNSYSVQKLNWAYTKKDIKKLEEGRKRLGIVGRIR